MALNIKDDHTDRLVRELAAETGETITTAVASRGPRATRATPRRGPRERRRTELTRITARSAGRRVKDSRDADEIVGYGPNGLPLSSSAVLDTSMLVAMLLDEPERDRFIAALADAEDPLISAGTLLEASIVVHSKLGDGGLNDLDELLSTAAVRCVAFDLARAHAAREAFSRFGKGRGAAGLNYGDGFSYALAKVTGRPLLFKGEDFGQTDVSAVVVA